MKLCLRQALIACCFLVNTQLEAQIVNVIAGNQGSPGYSGDGGPASACQFTDPTQICHDASGNLYIIDKGNYVVRKISTTGIITTIAGTGTPNTSASPTPTGGPATAVDLDVMMGIAIDATGNVYIGEGAYIRKITTAGIFTNYAGTGGAAGYSGDGGPATAAVINVMSLALDPAGNVVFVDYDNNVVRKINAGTGIISTIAGTTMGFSGDGGPATAAQLSNPRDAKFDAAGNMYILEGSNNTIRKVTPGGIISTIAGSSSVAAGYGGDGGPATAALLNSPDQLTIDASNNIYVADGLNRRIRRITPSGTISTYVGTGSWVWTGDGLTGTATGIWGVLGLSTFGGYLYFSEGWDIIRKISIPTSSLVEAHIEKNVSIAPNPCHNNVRFNVSSNINELATIEITDFTGRLISSFITNTNRDADINITTSPGLYFATSTTSTGRTTTKFIVQ